MHQNQWLAALEELGGMTGAFPIPNSFPQAQENTDFSYAYLGFQADGSAPVSGRWGEGPSIDGKGTFVTGKLQPSDQKPDLGMARPDSGAQAEQIG